MVVLTLSLLSLGGLVAAVTKGHEKIIGWNGHELHWNGHVLHKKQQKLHAHPPQFHTLVNENRELLDTWALGAMRSILANAKIEDATHPVIEEVLRVASDLVQSEDEELAEATMPVLDDSLTKLSTVKNPDVKSQVRDMRARMCASNPDFHREKCADFMKEYCEENPEKTEVCSAFFGPEEVQEEEVEEKVVKAPVKKNPGSMTINHPPHQQENVPDLPENGFEGKKTHHVDGVTQTDDWRMEFGPGQRDTYESVCSKHPDNEWCKLKGYNQPWHSGAVRDGGVGVVSAVVLAVVSVAMTLFL